jgi:endonuclease YncB( thermonuclease family)
VIPSPRRRAGLLLLWTFALAALAATGLIRSRQAAEIVGRAYIIDGDSLSVGGVEIRLYGIDAPEFRQICRRAARPWACGKGAARFLRQLIGGRELRCRPREEDVYRRTVAVCFVEGSDLGAAMVRAGQAVAYGAYGAEEQDARQAQRGIWSSQFEQPSEWRARHRRRVRGF